MKTPTSQLPGARVLRLVSTALPCHLCPADLNVPADPSLKVTFRPASGASRKVGLCARCNASRPSRGSAALGPADQAWRVVERHATTLRSAYENRRWIPRPGELALAVGLARIPWTEESVRAAVREGDPTIHGGQLIQVLEGGCLYLLLAHASADDPSLHSLRRLIDVLAAAAEQFPGGPPDAAA